MAALRRAQGFDAFHELILIDEVSRCGSGGVVWGLVEGLQIGLPPVLHFGSDELKARVAPDCLQGKKVICLCISEPYAGSDVAALRTTAVKDASGKVRCRRATLRRTALRLCARSSTWSTARRSGSQTVRAGVRRRHYGTLTRPTCLCHPQACLRIISR